MAEPFSIATGALSVLGAGLQASQSLFEFYRSCRDLDKDARKTKDRLEKLYEVFENLANTLKDRRFASEEQNARISIEDSIESCRESIEELKEQLEKFDKSSGSKSGVSIKIAGRRITYPFRKSTLKSLDENIEQIRDDLSLALSALNLQKSDRLEDFVTEMKSQIDSIKVQQVSRSIQDWLQAPDCSTDHYDNFAQRVPESGRWLVQHSHFQSWLKEEGQLLWLYGLPGTGKSVLSSTVVEHVCQTRKKGEKIAIGFFYFTFRENNKQGASAMVKALLLQLASQLDSPSADLNSLHENYRPGVAPLQKLFECLEELLAQFRDTYIVIDALDESPKGKLRSEVLSTLGKLLKQVKRGLHLFITSRDEPDIKDRLESMCTQSVSTSNEGVDNEITVYIQHELCQNPRLQKWRDNFDEISHSLASRANGNFRWVECQFDSLANCPRSPRMLRETLDSLPRSLDETYERILLRLESDIEKEYARKLLMLLCYSERPVETREIIDALAIELENNPGFRIDLRLQDETDLLSLCPGLIKVSEGEIFFTPWYPGKVLRIAHFSVQEYMESNRLSQSSISSLYLQPTLANAELAQLCLVYLMEFDVLETEEQRSLKTELPLSQYASQFWHIHYSRGGAATQNMENYLLRLFDDSEIIFRRWIKFLARPDLELTQDPLCTAASLGLTSTVQHLLQTKDVKTKSWIVFRDSKRLGSDDPLCQAVMSGHSEVVQILLDKDLEGYFNRAWALIRAARLDFKQIAEMILDSGVEIPQGVAPKVVRDLGLTSGPLYDKLWRSVKRSNQ